MKNRLKPAHVASSFLLGLGVLAAALVLPSEHVFAVDGCAGATVCLPGSTNCNSTCGSFPVDPSNGSMNIPAGGSFSIHSVCNGDRNHNAFLFASLNGNQDSGALCNFAGTNLSKKYCSGGNGGECKFSNTAGSSSSLYSACGGQAGQESVQCSVTMAGTINANTPVSGPSTPVSLKVFNPDYVAPGPSPDGLSLSPGSSSFVIGSAAIPLTAIVTSGGQPMNGVTLTFARVGFKTDGTPPDSGIIQPEDANKSAGNGKIELKPFPTIKSDEEIYVCIQAKSAPTVVFPTGCNPSDYTDAAKVKATWAKYTAKTISIEATKPPLDNPNKWIKVADDISSYANIHVKTIPPDVALTRKLKILSALLPKDPGGDASKLDAPTKAAICDGISGGFSSNPPPYGEVEKDVPLNKGKNYMYVCVKKDDAAFNAARFQYFYDPEVPVIETLDVNVQSTQNGYYNRKTRPFRYRLNRLVENFSGIHYIKSHLFPFADTPDEALTDSVDETQDISPALVPYDPDQPDQAVSLTNNYTVTVTPKTGEYKLGVLAIDNADNKSRFAVSPVKIKIDADPPNICFAKTNILDNSAIGQKDCAKTKGDINSSVPLKLTITAEEPSTPGQSGSPKLKVMSIQEYQLDSSGNRIPTRKMECDPALLADDKCVLYLTDGIYEYKLSSEDLAGNNKDDETDTEFPPEKGTITVTSSLAPKFSGKPVSASVIQYTWTLDQQVAGIKKFQLRDLGGNRIAPDISNTAGTTITTDLDSINGTPLTQETKYTTCLVACLDDGCTNSSIVPATPSCSSSNATCTNYPAPPSGCIDVTTLSRTINPTTIRMENSVGLQPTSGDSTKDLVIYDVPSSLAGAATPILVEFNNKLAGLAPTENNGGIASKVTVERIYVKNTTVRGTNLQLMSVPVSMKYEFVDDADRLKLRLKVSDTASIPGSEIGNWKDGEMYRVTVLPGVASAGGGISDRKLVTYFVVRAPAGKGFQYPPTDLEPPHAVLSWDSKDPNLVVIIRSKNDIAGKSYVSGFARSNANAMNNALRGASTQFVFAYGEVLFFLRNSEGNYMQKTSIAPANVKLTMTVDVGATPPAAGGLSQSALDYKIFVGKPGNPSTAKLDAVPGSQIVSESLQAQISDEGVYVLGAQAPTSLANAHPWPVPYKPSRGDSDITFDNLTINSTIRVFTIVGELVWQGDNIATASPNVVWTGVRNKDGQKVASGVYLYVIKNPFSEKKGKLVIIR